MNLNEARGQIAEKSAHLEKVMRDAGAEGKGLKELSTSLGDLLDEAQQACMKEIYQFRNKVIHDPDFRFSEQKLKDFLARGDLLIRVLSPRIDIDSDGEKHIARVNSTGYVDEAAYQWALKEGERRYGVVSPLAAHDDPSGVEAGAQPVRSITSKPKLLSKEQREGLQFESSPPKAEIGSSKRSAGSLGLKQDLKEVVKDAALKAVIGGVLKALKII